MEEPKLSGSYEALFEQVEYLLKKGDREQAMPIVERLYHRLSNLSENVRTRRPELEDLRVVVTSILASLYREDKKFDEAHALYEELLATTPETDHDDWELGLATLKIDSGEDVAGGLDILRGLSVAHPDDISIWLTLASGLIQLKLYDEGETTLKHAIEIKPIDDKDLRLAYGLLFVVYKSRGDYAEAERVWVQWMQASGDKDLIPLFELYFNAEDFEKVESWLEKEKNRLIAGFYRAQLAERRGDPAAKKLWEKVAAIDPTKFDRGWDMWAEAVLRSDGNPEDALAAINESIMQRTVTMRGVMLMAAAFFRMGNKEAVHKTLQDYIQGLIANGAARDTKIQYAHWQLFTELAPNPDDALEFETYFNTTPLTEQDTD